MTNLKDLENNLSSFQFICVGVFVFNLCLVVLCLIREHLQ